MDSKILKNLKGIFATYSDDDINQICAPLEALKIHHFHFMRSFKNGNYVSICKNRKWQKFFYTNKLFNHAHYTRFKMHFNGPILWSEVNESPVIIENRNFFGLTNNGITLVVNNKESRDAYHFSSYSPEQCYLIFNNHIDLLYRFTLYFQEKAHLIIDQAQQYQIKIFSENTKYDLISASVIEEFVNKTPIKRFYLEDYNCYLTKKELEMVRRYIQGSSIVEIADRSFLSQKTVQTHINKVKNKLSCKKISKLVKILADSNLL